MKRLTPLSYDEAKSRAGMLCSRCEQCTPDLLKKFSNWGLPADQSRQLIEELRRLGWVDDARFARAYAHDKLVFSGWGKAKIISGLYAKRLDRASIEGAFADIDKTQYCQIAFKVIESKSSKLDLSDYEDRARVMRFGLSRGFEAALISRIIKYIEKHRKMTDD